MERQRPNGIRSRQMLGVLLGVVLGIVLGLAGNTATTYAQEATPTPGLSPEFLAAYDRLQERGGHPVPDRTGEDAQSAGGWPAASTWVVALLGVGGLAYGSLWGWRRLRWMGGHPLARSGEQIQIREERSLGPAQRLVLAQVGENLLLLGVTEQQITLLTRLDADSLAGEDEFAARLAQATATPQTPPPFVAADLSPEIPERVESLRALRRGVGFHAVTHSGMEAAGHV